MHTVQADISKPDEAANAVAAASRAFGGLDILVNNAGVGSFANVDTLALDDWNRMIGTNLNGLFHCCRAAIPALRARGGGWIINISSLSSTQPFAGGAAYCATKAAVTAFSDAHDAGTTERQHPRELRAARVDGDRLRRTELGGGLEARP